MSKKIAGSYMMYTTKIFDMRELEKADTWMNEMQPEFVGMSVRGEKSWQIFVTVGQCCEPTVSPETKVEA